MVTTTGFADHGITHRGSVPIANPIRRLITPEAGRALEILGHAIDYLTDEYINEAMNLSANDPKVEAIQLLMALNRQIYYECPVVPTFTERVRAFFHLIANRDPCVRRFNRAL